MRMPSRIVRTILITLQLIGVFLLIECIALCQTSNPPNQAMYWDIGVFRDGFLWILNAQGNGQYQAGVDHVFGYGGLAGDYPVVGNWNGSNCVGGCFNVGIYRSSTQYFLLDTNGNAFVDAGDQYFRLSIAQPTDLPVAADWNGDGRTKVGLFRPSTCEWFLDYDGDGIWNATNDQHFQANTCQAGDVPVVGDWTGIGKARIGIYRAGVWLLDTSGYGTYSTTITYGFFSNVADVPIVGLWYPAYPWVAQLGILQQDLVWVLAARGNNRGLPA